jgi:predicted DNA-binding protein
MKNITTIKLSTETKERLDKLKEHDKESYDQTLQKIFYILNKIRADPESAQSVLRKIESRARKRNQYTK